MENDGKKLGASSFCANQFLKKHGQTWLYHWLGGRLRLDDLQRMQDFPVVGILGYLATLQRESKGDHEMNIWLQYDRPNKNLKQKA